MKRSAPKRTQPKRDWTAAREKVDGEGMCRVAGRHGQCAGRLEAAHIIGREHDRLTPNQEGMRPKGSEIVWPVKPIRIVPLCTRHHNRYDGREYPRVDLLGHLTAEEEAQAVLDADGLELARRRICPSAYKETRRAA